jgi:hypothetical protein
VSGAADPAVFPAIWAPVRRLREVVEFPAMQGEGQPFSSHTIQLCQSNGTKWTRQLLAKHGYDPTSFTEKSNKVQWMTDLLDAGEQVPHVMVFRRWRSTTL